MDADLSVDVRCSSFREVLLVRLSAMAAKKVAKKAVKKSAQGHGGTQIVAVECSCVVVNLLWHVRDAGWIASLEACAWWDELLTSRLTSSGLAQGGEEGGEEDREEGGEEVQAPERGEEAGWQEACGGHEEGGPGHLRAEDAFAGPGGDLRQEGDAAH